MEQQYSATNLSFDEHQWSNRIQTWWCSWSFRCYSLWSLFVHWDTTTRGWSLLQGFRDWMLAYKESLLASAYLIPQSSLLGRWRCPSYTANQTTTIEVRTGLLEQRENWKERVKMKNLLPSSSGVDIEWIVTRLLRWRNIVETGAAWVWTIPFDRRQFFLLVGFSNHLSQSIFVKKEFTSTRRIPASRIVTTSSMSSVPDFVPGLVLSKRCYYLISTVNVNWKNMNGTFQW